MGKTRLKGWWLVVVVGIALAALTLGLVVAQDVNRSTHVEATSEQPTDAAVRDALAALEGVDAGYDAWRARERTRKWQAPPNPHSPRDAFLKSGVPRTREDVCDALGTADLVIVPDFHDVPLGRVALTRLVRLLTDAAQAAGRPKPAGLCLEALRARSQPELERWVEWPRPQALAALMKLLEAEWPFPVLEYEELFLLCLDLGIPIVGVGVPECAFPDEALAARLLVSPCDDLLRTPVATFPEDDGLHDEGCVTKMSKATMRVILDQVHQARKVGRTGPFILLMGAAHVFERRDSIVDLADKSGLRVEVAVLDIAYWKRRLWELRGDLVESQPLSFEDTDVWWLPLTSMQEIVNFVEKHREQLARRDALRRR